MNFEFDMEKIKKIAIIVLGLLLVVLIFLGLYNYVSNNNDNPDIYSDDIISKNEEDVDNKEGQKIIEDSGLNLQEELLPLNLEFEDAVAWLKVPNTSIDFSIFQSEDNSRYLRKDRNNVNTGWGETFLDYRTDINDINENMIHYIIYGHNTEEDTCFTPLLKYKEKDFYEENNIIYFSTLNGNYAFEIFSVYQTTTDFYYINTDFKDMEQYQLYIDGLASKSMYDTGVKVTNEDTILTLSTCDYYVKDIGRFVVQAKLID